MTTRVELDAQPFAFIRRLAPEPRRRVRQALHELERGQADVKPLQGSFVGYWRLRSGGYRVVFRYAMEEGWRTAKCIFAERRSVVYDLFAEKLQRLAAARLSQKPKHGK